MKRKKGRSALKSAPVYISSAKLCGISFAATQDFASRPFGSLRSPQGWHSLRLAALTSRVTASLTPAKRLKSRSSDDFVLEYPDPSLRSGFRLAAQTPRERLKLVTD